ncbi:leucyl aminopeptidase [Agreia sp. COWG]|uniref:leucyl aminopeptidase n=1 Tax=Agreia sp. COWG TaxID=2773266 RepID=UPI0019269C0C|nr:leucyl aminopeptidase [Agreia sp. COWG]CAD5998939.1 putative cytosol aminopeptidase [Agreia sp. COWG]
MTLASVSVSATPASEVETDVLVLGVVRTDDGPRLVGAADATARLAAALGDLTLLGITGSKDDFIRLPSPEGIAARSLALVGLASEAPSSAELRYATGSVARRLLGAVNVALALPVSDDDSARAALEGCLLGAYDYTNHRSEASMPKASAAASFVLVTDIAVSATAVNKAVEIGRAVHLVRDLVNESPLDLYPDSFARRATELADLPGVTVTTWNEEQLAADGFGGILGVGQGSVRPPRLVKVSYSPAQSARHIALVGKGITFDSGGLSLKPAASMIGMKYDMAGAATVLAVVLAAARLELPTRVTAWLCLAENMPSGTAIRPGDVLGIRGGKTVEVLNTDAEGRLVLADGLAAASEEYPDAIIDVATLTGAATVALGNRYVGTMGSSELVKEVIDTAGRTGELLWHMPLAEEFRAMINSDVADLANIKPGNTAGGMLLAGVFLGEFIGNTEDGSGRIPWVHLDIAGAGTNKDALYGYTGKGPTGVVVRTLVALAEGGSGASVGAA